MVQHLSVSPVINHYPAFFSSEVCNEIIELAKDLVKPSKVIAPDGSDKLDENYRFAETCSIDNDKHTAVDFICGEIERITGLNRARYEKFTVTHYNPGGFYKQHQDYFHEVNGDPDELSKRCSLGGNRVSTVIIYLNTPDSGGETYFPWLDLAIKPSTGSVLHFEYGHSDNLVNIKTTHAGLSPISGDKWIVTLWVREDNIRTKVTEYKKFTTEQVWQEQVNHVEYVYDEISNGGSKFNLIVEGNTDPSNTIIVGYDGSKASNLLLYMLGALNIHQEIPWVIQPVCPAPAADYVANLVKLNEIKNKANLVAALLGKDCKIRGVDFVSIDGGVDINRNGFLYSLWSYVQSSPRARFRRHNLVYLPDTADSDITDDEKIQDLQIFSAIPGLWHTPFANLISTEINTIVKKLDLGFM